MGPSQTNTPQAAAREQSAGSVVVIGGGVAGLSTAWHLVQSGQSVILVEAEDQLALHSSSRSASILRTACLDADLAPIAAEGARFLVQPPPRFTQGPLIDPVGLIVLGRPGERDLGVLSPEDFASRAPFFRAGPGSARLFADQGRIDVPALLEGFAAGVRQGGGQLRLGCRVAKLEGREQTSSLRVHLNTGEALDASAVVLAAGGWAESLGRALGSPVRLTPTLRTILVTEPSPKVDARWPIVWNERRGFYARAEAGGLLLCSCDEVACDPDRVTVDEGTLAAIRKDAAEHLTIAVPPTAKAWAGVRTLTEDHQFVLGPDPVVQGLFWAAGLGGHGITCGAAVGRITAESITLGTPPPNAARATRFPL